MRIAQSDILEFSRDPGHVSPSFPAGYWPAAPEPPDEKAWDRSVNEFCKDLDSLCALVADEKNDLSKPFTHGDGQTLLREALLTVDHNVYHLGSLCWCGACWARGTWSSCLLVAVRLAQAHGYGFYDLLMDFVNGEVALDCHNPIGLARSDLAVLLPHAAVELVLLALETAFVLAILRGGTIVAPPRALQTFCERGQQKNCEIGLERAADEAVQFPHCLRAELAPAALVGLGGVGEPVAQDDSA